MKTHNKVLAIAGITVALSLGTVVPAEAHTPAASLDCTHASISLKDYDANAVGKVVLDGQEKLNGKFGGRFVVNYPLTGNTEHTLTVKVVSTDGARYNFDYAKTTTGCYTPPPTPKDALARVSGAVGATCTSPSISTFDIINARWDDENDTLDGSRTATADSGHLFADGAAQFTLTYPVEPQLDPTLPPCYTPPPVIDVCPNIDGNQETVPAGYILQEGECVLPPPPPVDVCPDIEGNQGEYPYPGDLCTPPVTPPVDVCPDIEGDQPEGTDCNPVVIPPTATPTPQPTTQAPAYDGSALVTTAIDARPGLLIAGALGAVGLLLVAVHQGRKWYDKRHPQV